MHHAFVAARAIFLTCSSGLACRAVNVHPDFAIRREDVTIQSGAITLAGTLVLPGAPGRRPAIVVLHGSGPDTRADLESDAKWFSEQGLVVLMYDKRGVGKSTGNLGLASYEELATDALAAVALLRLRPEVDPTRIGVWGPSEGGWVAPIAAAQSPDIAFVILKSGIAVTPEEQMDYAWRNSLLAENAPDSTIVAIEHARKLVWTYARTGDGEAEARAALDLAKKLPGFPSDPESVGLVAQVPPFSVLNDPSLADKMFFVRTRSRFEPRPFLERVRVPTLAVLGRDDTDTPVDRTASVLRDAFQRSGNADLAVVILPGDDHYLEHATASGKREMDPEYYRVVRDWLARHRFLQD
jgi:fermentation-respiration switch protein FrsA (DUF1100 family)